MSEKLLPRILVIGAMKAGTSSFCTMLARHPRICLPATKEPHTLMGSGEDEDRVRSYGRMYRGLSTEELICDGSTGYGKLPWCRDVPERARRILGNDLRVFFLVRDPVARARSHHAHLLRARPELPEDFCAALELDATIARFSLYVPVVRCWLEEIEESQLRLVSFESLMTDPQSTMRSVFEFLELDGPEAPDVVSSDYANRGSDVWQPPAALAALKSKVSRSRFYKEWVRPGLPDVWVTQGKRLVRGKQPKRVAREPSRNALISLEEQFTPDLSELRRCYGHLIIGSVPQVAGSRDRAPGKGSP